MKRQPFEFEAQTTPRTFADNASEHRGGVTNTEGAPADPERVRHFAALNDECHNRDGITRKGDSIVPPNLGKLCTCSRTSPDSFHGHHAECPQYVADRFYREPASHRTDPHTSKTAATSVAPTAAHHRKTILVALKLFGPATGHELAQRLTLQYVQVAKRLSELHAEGFVQRRETGTHNGQPLYQTRNSPTGRPACVWHLNPTGPTPQESTEPA